jgi:renalase
VDVAGGGLRRARRLLLTAPVPQALDLLEGVALPGATRGALEAVDYAPCYAVMAGYADVAPPDWPGVRLSEHPDLAWVAHDSHKRRAPSGTTLVLHATPAFSRGAGTTRPPR